MIAHRWRLCHYDPALRDARGAFRGDSWTSCSDVGQSFDGIQLTWERYLTAEDAHVSCALDFLADSGLAALQVVGLEQRGGGRAPPEAVELPTLAEGIELGLDDLEAVLRGLLREQLWCRLEAPDFYLHVGYDYYLYIGSSQPCPAGLAKARERGLFVEEKASPYEA